MSTCRKRNKECVPRRNPWPGASPTMEVTRPCLKKAKHFFVVTYSELFPHRHRETKMEDIFGFCHKCVSSMERPKAYTSDNVADLRGVVGRIERTDCDPEVFKGDQHQTRLDVIKSGIVRQMNQKNMRDLTPDDWKEIFASAVEEFIVAGVQNS